MEAESTFSHNRREQPQHLWQNMASIADLIFAFIENLPEMSQLATEEPHTSICDGKESSVSSCIEAPQSASGSE
jgi:hypothetical protein